MLTNLRTHSKSIFWGAGTATALILGFLLVAHLWQDHQDHHLIVQVLQYNIMRGKLDPLPAPVPLPPAVAVTPAPSAPKPEKP